MQANRKHMKFNGLFEYFGFLASNRRRRSRTEFAIRYLLFAIRNSLLACAITLEEILGISGENPFVTMLSTWATLTAAVATAASSACKCLARFLYMAYCRVLWLGCDCDCDNYSDCGCCSALHSAQLHCRGSITMTLHFSWPLRQGRTVWPKYIHIYVHTYAHMYMCM